MLYSKYTLSIALWSILSISCAQTQSQTPTLYPVQRGSTATENPKNEVDPKDVESYWTKERMEKAKPMPTPGVVIDPNAPKISPPDSKSNGQGTPGGEQGEPYEQSGQ